MTDRLPPDSPPDLAWLRLFTIALAVVAPPMLAFSLTPSPTLLNQLLAVGGWGLWLAFEPTSPSWRAGMRAAWPLVAALALVGLGILASWGPGTLPTSLALPPFGLVAFAGVLAVLGAARARDGLARGEGDRVFEPLAVALVAVGLLSALVAVEQVFRPEWGDAIERALHVPEGTLLARSGLPGRAVGNLRQPNHLATLLVWGVVALVPLVEARRLPRWLASIFGALLVLGIVLSGSRTGQYAGAGVLVLWGLLDIKLSPQTRVMLVASVLVGVACWFAVDHWSASTGHVFGARQRLSEGDSSHFAIWRNTVAMIGQQPWTGVGWGEFNFAWTLTPFPDRPVAFFDHTHDLPLQLAVELGVPAAAVILALLLGGLVVAGLRAWRADTSGDPRPGHALARTLLGLVGVGLLVDVVRGWRSAVRADASARAAVMLVLVVAVHSLDEYPLWYAYFLLPAAWAFGTALGRVRGGETAAVPVRDDPRGDVARRAVGAVMMAVAVLGTIDYHTVSTIFSDDDGLPPLAARIHRGEMSPLFAHHADYADATTTEPPSAALPAIGRAARSLLDTRLMIAWANALDETGHAREATYLAARLREFRKDDAADFFAPCADTAATAQPFQCRPDPAGLTWRDLR